MAHYGTSKLKTPNITTENFKSAFFLDMNLKNSLRSKILSNCDKIYNLRLDWESDINFFEKLFHMVLCKALKFWRAFEFFEF